MDLGRCFQVALLDSGRLLETLPDLYSIDEAMHFITSYALTGCSSKAAIVLANVDLDQLASNLRAMSINSTNCR